MTEIKKNVMSPKRVGVNIMYEFYYIASDIAAEITNDFYEDWFSFSFWLGDIFYRLFVVHNDPNLDRFA